MKKLMKKLVALVCVCVAFVATPVFSANFSKGMDAYLDGDYFTALREWEPLAERGIPHAQHFLGVMYYNGEGLPQDYKEAFKWYKLSAEQGDKDSQFYVGWMYNKGEGVPQDYRESAKWYTLAAEQGYAQAQYNLGFMYYSGHGVLQDYIRAHMWFNISASNDDETAPESRDIVANKLTPNQIVRAQDLARKCLEKDYKGC